MRNNRTPETSWPVYACQFRYFFPVFPVSTAINDCPAFTLTYPTPLPIIQKRMHFKRLEWTLAGYCFKSMGKYQESHISKVS